MTLDGGVEGLERDTDDLYEHAPCAFVSTQPDGTIIRANRTFLNWSARSADLLVGRVRFQTLLTVGSRIYYETHYAPLLHMQGFVNEIALEIHRENDTSFPVVASARQLRDERGAPIVNRIALFDSTDRRRYERELLHARRQAEEAAEKLANADRQKNIFIAMLAHELRNPLAPIRSAVEVFRRSTPANPIVGKATSMLRRQVGQLTRLVEDLLDISRIGEGKLSLRRLPVDLASVVHHAVETSEEHLRNAGVGFTLTLPSDPIYVSADATRLMQVIGNLLNNAAKFTPPDGHVTLELSRDDAHALIRVRDTGVGIEPAKLVTVFDLFMQAEHSLDRNDGLGIGLTLAKTLVERHDGRITVHSDGAGQGTEFLISLPVLLDSPRSVSRSVPASAADTHAPQRILVVDDNQDSAEMMAMLLELFGHQVRMAHDGVQAVETSATFEPHVVLMDIGLPRLNGYEAAQQIRAHAGFQPILIALTGWGQDDDSKRSAAAGFHSHLVKPVDPDVLAKLIRDVSSSTAS
jgi:signal transduction histidine kinase/ActR/RegA family two-component response regulator